MDSTLTGPPPAYFDRRGVTRNWASFPVAPEGRNQWNTQQRFHNAANEITRIQAIPSWSTPIYDARGNPISQIPQPAAPGLGFRMLYDPWDRLVTVLNQNGTFLAGYAYDGLNRRIVKRVPGAPGRHYYYSGDWQVLDERLEIPNVPLIDTPPEREYVWGLRGLDDLILRERSTLNDGNLDERLYALADDNFNIVGIVNPSGTVQERYEFDGYALPTFEQADFQPLGLNQSAFEWNVLFAGYYLDPETGLYLARNRLFHPGLGRWLQRDPAGYGDSANLYQYCLSGPGTYTDPTGEVVFIPILIVLGVAGLLGGGAIGYYAIRSEMTQKGTGGQVLNQASLGALQGVANSIYGTESGALGVLNLPGMAWNWTAGWVAPNVPYIEVGDWSRGLFVDETDRSHWVSTFLGGEGILTLATLGLSKLRYLGGIPYVGRVRRTLWPERAPVVGGYSRAAIDAVLATPVRTRIRRFGWDWRAFSGPPSGAAELASANYWIRRSLARGHGLSLHHYLYSQTSRLPLGGFRNAGFNLLELPRGINSWMGRVRGAVQLRGVERLAAIGTEHFIRFGVPAYALHPFALSYWAWKSHSR